MVLLVTKKNFKSSSVRYQQQLPKSPTRLIDVGFNRGATSCCCCCPRSSLHFTTLHMPYVMHSAILFSIEIARPPPLTIFIQPHHLILLEDFLGARLMQTSWTTIQTVGIYYTCYCVLLFVISLLLLLSKREFEIQILIQNVCLTRTIGILTGTGLV